MPELTKEERALLRQFYTPQAIPKCRICGEELSMQDSRTKEYGCSGYMPDPELEGHLILKPGRSFLDDHYKNSLTVFFGQGSTLVIKALDCLESAEREASLLRAMIEGR